MQNYAALGNVLFAMEVHTSREQSEHPLFQQVYGRDKNPTLNTILLQLCIVDEAYPGLMLDLFKYFNRLTDSDTYITMKNNGVPLVLLCSLLHMPKSMEHGLDNEVQLIEGEIELRAQTRMKQTIDLSFATNSFKTSIVPDEQNSLDWRTDVHDNLEKLAYLMTVPASPATLSLFVHKGPSQANLTKGDSSFDKDFFGKHLPMTLFSQPPHNTRLDVQDKRFQDLVKICSVKTQTDLVSHGACVLFYRIVSNYNEIPYDPNNDRFKEQQNPTLRTAVPLEVRHSVESAYDCNKVKSCYITENASQDLIGTPHASRLSEHRNRIQGGVDWLFPVLLGCEYTDLVHFDSAEITSIFTEPTQEQRRLREHVLSSLLIKLVNIEYHGFSTIKQWCRLYNRLTTKLQMVCRCLSRPTTVYDLVYQCMILTQSVSRFRLSFLDGLGRHFTVTHSLLGIKPDSCFLPQLEASLLPFSPSLVGETNMKIDSVDLGYERFDDHNHQQQIQQLSQDLQKRAETIEQVNLINFMTKVIKEMENLYVNRKWMELELPLKDRTKGQSPESFYKKERIESFAREIPAVVAKRVAEEVETAKDDDKNSVIALVKDQYIKSESKLKDPLGWQAGWEQNRTWFEEETMSNFLSGYLTRSSSIKLPETTDLIWLLSHPWYYVPGKNSARTILLFLHNGGVGTMPWNETQFFFPNPYSDQSQEPVFSTDGVVSFFVSKSFLVSLSF